MQLISVTAMSCKMDALQHELIIAMSGKGNTSSSSGSSGSSSSGRGSIRRSGNNNTCYAKCTICSERYGAADKIYAGSCGHVFHWQCLERWWKESFQCPICRKKTQDYHQIYLDFEEQAEGHSSGQGSSRGRETSDYETLKYEAALYRDEIKYLNARIGLLTHHQLNLYLTSDSD